MNKKRVAVILGMADGLTLAAAEIISLLKHQDAIFHAGLGAGVGELVGMFAAVYLSDDSGEKEAFWPAIACGVATLLACLLPVVPYALSTGNAALIAAACISIVIGGVIAWLRPEKGTLAVVETFGVLVAAGALCYAASFI